MRFDVRIDPSQRLRADADLIRQAESWGFAGAWVAEAGRNPFFALTIGAKETTKIQLGPLRAAAFSRSPMVLAQIAWGLARQSSGRFCLGLDARGVSPHDQGDGVGRMREYIESLRAIWRTFQTDARLRYRGQFYTFRLMAPFFNPGPIEHPEIAIFLASNDPALAELAGALCQGLHVGAFHTAGYLRDVLKPAVSAGLKAAGRAESDFALAVPAFVATGMSNADLRLARNGLKMRIAEEAGKPESKAVIAHHGWDLSVKGSDSSPEPGGQITNVQISDELVDQIAIIAPPGDVLERISERYAGLADRVSLELSSESSNLMEAIAASRSARP